MKDTNYSISVRNRHFNSGAQRLAYKACEMRGDALVRVLVVKESRHEEGIRPESDL